MDTRVVGVTLAHPPAHSLHLKNNHYDPAVATDAAWVKILTWRANGDGFGLQGNAYMEDCFIRANDVNKLWSIIECFDWMHMFCCPGCLLCGWKGHEEDCSLERQ